MVSRTLEKNPKQSFTYIKNYIRGLLNFEKHVLPSGMPFFLSALPPHTFGLW